MFKNDQYIFRNLMRFRKIFNSIVAGHSCKHLCECLTTFFFFHGALAIPQSNFFWYFLLKQAQFLGVMLALLARSFQPTLRLIKAYIQVHRKLKFRYTKKEEYRGSSIFCRTLLLEMTSRVLEQCFFQLLSMPKHCIF